MKIERKTIRTLCNRIFMATILSLSVPLIGSNSTRAFGQDGFSIGFSNGGNDMEFLAAYGQWMDVAPYGQVWVPSVASDWRPFAYGNWIWTNDGWLWSSYEPYGWLVYHYGHWDYQPDIGWFWIPGTTWSPAAVVWLNFGDYICWAPSPPMGIHWPQPWEPEPTAFNVWIGVRIGDFDRENVGGFRLPEFPRRGVITREHVFSGPPNVSTIRRYSNHPIVARRFQRRLVHWPDHHFDRIILPRSQHAINQRWQHDIEGRVYMHKGAAPEQRQRVENRSGQRESKGQQSGQYGRQQRGQKHGTANGHQERGRRR
jgi:hypothetical protein